MSERVYKLFRQASRDIVDWQQIIMQDCIVYTNLYHKWHIHFLDQTYLLISYPQIQTQSCFDIHIDK